MAFLSQASPFGCLLLPHDDFQEYAAHPAGWSAALHSQGSERTCIRLGLATFLHCACTAHPDFVVEDAITQRKPPEVRIWTLRNQSPVEPVREPDQGDPSRVGGTSGFDVAFLLQGQLCVQEEVLRCEDRSWRRQRSR